MGGVFSFLQSSALSRVSWDPCGIPGKPVGHLLVKRGKVTCLRSHANVTAEPAVDLGGFSCQLGLFLLPQSAPQAATGSLHSWAHPPKPPPLQKRGNRECYILPSSGPPSPPGKLLLLLVHTKVPPIFHENFGPCLAYMYVPVTTLVWATGMLF